MLMGNLFNVRDYGAVGNGIADDTSAIQRAVDAATAASGGTVYLPSATYLISATIRITKQIRFVGDGWETTWSDAASARGTWIRVEKENFNAIYVFRASGAVVSDIAFVYKQPAPSSGWKPGAFEPSIVVENARDVVISNIFLFNPTRGILFFHGQGLIERVLGNPIQMGIEIENNHDVVNVSHVHFWRFWEGTFNNHDKDILTSWRTLHGVGIRCGRADNPLFQRIFLIGFDKGFLFENASEGPTSKFQINMADCDSCRVGIQVGGTHATGMISNFQSQGSPGVAGLKIYDDARVQAVNLRLTSNDTNAIRIADSGRLQLSNAWIENWNRSNNGFPGIEATDSAAAFVDGPLLFDRGNGAHRWKGNVNIRDDALIEERNISS